jgi:hypothetical protein
MIKGMQEQQQKIEEQQAENKTLKDEVAELRQMVLSLKNSSTGGVAVTSARLEDVSPNPASGTAIIRYQVPNTATTATILLTNAEGQQLKAISLSKRGTGQVSLNTTMLAVGTYNYSL